MPLLSAADSLERMSAIARPTRERAMLETNRKHSPAIAQMTRKRNWVFVRASHSGAARSTRANLPLAPPVKSEYRLMIIGNTMASPSVMVAR